MHRDHPGPPGWSRGPDGYRDAAGDPEHLHRVVEVGDPAVARWARRVVERPDTDPAFLAWQRPDGGWQPVHSSHVNAYVHTYAGLDARGAYIHPGVFTAFEQGRSIRPAVTAAANRAADDRLAGVWRDPAVQAATIELLS